MAIDKEHLKPQSDLTDLQQQLLASNSRVFDALYKGLRGEMPCLRNWCYLRQRLAMKRIFQLPALQAFNWEHEAHMTMLKVSYNLYF